MAGKIIIDTIDTDNAFITLNVQQSLIATMNVSGIYSNTGVKMIGANGTISNTAITGLVTAAQIATVANTQITGNITSSQITSNPTFYGNVSVTGAIGVGGATPTSNGSGITFPATQSASSDANTLDDYEEGTWTPLFRCTTTNPTYTVTSATGKYTKVGNVVYYSFYLYSSGGATGGSGSVVVGGLPFTAGYTSVRGFPTYLFWGGVNKWAADGRNGLGWGASDTDAFLSLYASSAVYANGAFEIGGTGFYYVT